MRATQWSPVVVVLGLMVGGCPSCVRPDPGASDVGGSCDQDIPCLDGLTCVEGVCVGNGTSSGGSSGVVGSSSSGGSSGASGGSSSGGTECAVQFDCPVDGSLDGRACMDGRCVWIACTDDAQCGRRFCVDGQCADRTVCTTDGECAAENGVCEMGVCVAACTGDTECNQGGLPINTCADGRCRQRCFGDVTCTLNGGICEGGVCIPPQCNVDVDCQEGGAMLRCDTGRCVPFTACQTEMDCPANNACQMNICVELPVCARDQDCAPEGVCQAGRCRPVTACGNGGSCPMGTECVGGSCVPATGCRGNNDCTAPLICRAGACAMPPMASVARILIATPQGLCDPVLDTAAACRVTVRPGDSLGFSAVALDAAGRLVSGVTFDWTSDVTATADVTAGPATMTVLTAGMMQGSAHVTASARGITSPAVTVVNLGASTAAVRVTVVDGRNGAALPNATVQVNSTVLTTLGDGVAEFDGAMVTAPYQVTVFHQAFDYVTVDGLAAPAAGTLEVFLPLTPAVPGQTSAGLRGTVNLENAPSEGPVSFALAGVSAPNIPGLSFTRLLGDTFNVEVTLPVVGAQSIPLPGGITLSAEVPVLGQQNIKDSFDALGTGGRRIAWAFGGRIPFGAVQGLIGQQGPVGVLFALAPYFEGLTHGLQTGLLLNDLPYVVDGETEFDGEADVDGDGNQTELVPDYFAFPQSPLTVRQEQTLRASVRVAGLPQNTQGNQALLAAGARVPGHGFVPLGLTAAAPAAGGAITRTMKMAPRYGGLETGDYAVAVFAFGPNGVLSLRTVAQETLTAEVDLGTMLPFPSASTYVVGTRTVTVNGLAAADVHRATLEGPTGRWRVYVAGGGTMHSVVLPAVPMGLPERAQSGVNMEALQVSAALRAATVDAQVQTLVDPGVQGLSRLPQETQGMARGALRAP